MLSTFLISSLTVSLYDDTLFALSIKKQILFILPLFSQLLSQGHYSSDYAYILKR